MSHEAIIEQVKTLQVDQVKARYRFSKEQFDGFSGATSYPELAVCAGGSRNVSFCLDNALPVEIVHQNPQAEFMGYKQSFLRLGIDLVAMILHGQTVLQINLTHRLSTIEKLYVYAEETRPFEHAQLTCEQTLEMRSFDYFPRRLERHPLTSYAARAIADSKRPAFYPVWKDPQDNLKQTSAPDSMVLAAPVEGLLALAEMFLDFGRDENAVDELNLETTLYGGMEGSRPGSLETRFWLPGSFAFPQQSLDDVQIPEFP